MRKEADLPAKSVESLHFEAGDLVEVRSIQEILTTLDNKSKLGGIAFTPQMTEFCGKTFTICKKVTRMILESTGELRTLKIPTVMLEGVVCNGKAHGGCDRSCLYLWPEAWVKKTPSVANKEQKGPIGGDSITDIPERCQANFPDLTQATLPDTRSALQLRRYWWRFKRGLWHLRVLGLFGFTSWTFFSGNRKQVHSDTKAASLNLQPGDYIEVRSLKEIFATLDNDDKLKGMRFNREMAKFSGGRFRVYKRLDKMISEEDGKLLKVKTPTVMLEGAFCDGKSHGMCDRYCFAFWREAWLRKIPDEERTSQAVREGASDHTVKEGE